MKPRILVSLFLAFTLAACGGDDRPSDDDGGRVDTGTDTGSGEDQCVVALPVDILWVIDNSNSMAEEQDNLALNFEALIDELTHPPDLDDDGEADYLPVDDVRMGVVTTDMGVGDQSPRTVLGCGESGDEGRLVYVPRNDDPDCDDVRLVDAPYLSYTVGQDDPAELTHEFSCLARLGTDGCGFEQQLAAMERGLEEGTGTTGANQGFVRGNSLVAVIVVSDEDDCSVNDTGLFDPSPTGNSLYGPSPSRCWTPAINRTRLESIDRYVGFLRGLRLDRAGDVVFAAITGVPGDLVRDPLDVDYAALLADPRMQYRASEDDPDKLAPACSFGGVGEAIPGRRLVEVARDFATDGEGLVQSICSTDFRPAIRAIARLIGGKLCPPLI